MRRILLLFALFISVSAFGQTTLGIKGGLNIADIVMTNYINPDVESDLGIKTGVHAGLFLSGTIGERLGMGAELLYSNKGVHGGTRINLHYITVPLLVQYGLSDKIFAEIGPELGYLFSARSAHGDVSSTYNNKFDLALDAGFRFYGSRLIFDLRYCVGLFSVREPMLTSGPSREEKIKYQNRVLQISVGYKLWTLE